MGQVCLESREAMMKGAGPIVVCMCTGIRSDFGSFCMNASISDHFLQTSRKAAIRNSVVRLH